MKRSVGIATPSLKNIVQPPGLRLPGVNLHPVNWSSQTNCLNTFEKWAGLFVQSLSSFPSTKSILNQAITLGCERLTNCCSPNCRRFLGDVTRIAAIPLPMLSSPGKAKSLCRSWQISPGRKRQKTHFHKNCKYKPLMSVSSTSWGPSMPPS